MRSTANVLLKLGVVALGLFPLAASAAPGTPASAADYARLPDFCQAKIGAYKDDLAQKRYWEQVYGVDPWMHMHHYCLGILFLNKARLGMTKADREAHAWYLGEAASNYDYVIRAWPPGFELQADAILGQGQAYQLNKQDIKAIGAYMKAISLRPDFAAAYALLADAWAARGDKAKAREVLQQGLQNTGNDEMLARRLARLEATPSVAPHAGQPLPGRATGGAPSTQKP